MRKSADGGLLNMLGCDLDRLITFSSMHGIMANTKRLTEEGNESFVPFLKATDGLPHNIIVYMINFLYEHGWEIRLVSDTRKNRLPEAIERFEALRMAHLRLMKQLNELAMSDDRVDEVMQEWVDWIPYMPKAIQNAYALFKENRSKGVKWDTDVPPSLVDNQC